MNKDKGSHRSYDNSRKYPVPPPKTDNKRGSFDLLEDKYLRDVDGYHEVMKIKHWRKDDPDAVNKSR